MSELNELLKKTKAAGRLIEAGKKVSVAITVTLPLSPRDKARLAIVRNYEVWGQAEPPDSLTRSQWVEVAGQLVPRQLILLSDCKRRK